MVLTINYVSVHDMTIQDKLLQRQEDAARGLQENQRSRADELRELQSDRATENLRRFLTTDPCLMIALVKMAERSRKAFEILRGGFLR